MRAVNITFQHGHFYNSNTSERILVEEGVNYILIFEKETDVKVDNFEKPQSFLTAKQILNSITSDPDVTHIKKIASAGTRFYFFISEQNENNKEEEADYPKRQSKKQSRFRITLLEDLFLYSNKTWKDKDFIEGGKLSDCACVVDESKDDELPFFEVIYAKSVNSAYKKTHVHYFGNAGSPSKNSFKSIYLSSEKHKDNLLETKRGFSDKDKV
jgi:hypothetical protein